MVTFIAVFTIFSGMASLLGFAYIFFGSSRGGYKRLCAVGLGFATVWSVYIVLVPDSATIKNVAAKVAYYRTESSARSASMVLVQSGDVLLSECGSVEVEFIVPYKSPPTIEIVDIDGHGDFPVADAVTPVKATFDSTRGGAGPCLPDDVRNRYRWVATGTPIGERAD